MLSLPACPQELTPCPVPLPAVGLCPVQLGVGRAGGGAAVVTARRGSAEQLCLLLVPDFTWGYPQVTIMLSQQYLPQSCALRGHGDAEELCPLDGVQGESGLHPQLLWRHLGRLILTCEVRVVFPQVLQ